MGRTPPGPFSYLQLFRPVVSLTSRTMSTGVKSEQCLKPNLKLRTHRRERGMSREKLGALAGFTGKTIRDIELGITREPRAQTLRAIASALGCKVAEIE